MLKLIEIPGAMQNHSDIAPPLRWDEPAAAALTLIDSDLVPGTVAVTLSKGTRAAVAAVGVVVLVAAGVAAAQYQLRQSALAAIAKAGLEAEASGLLSALSHGDGQLIAPFHKIGIDIAQTPGVIEAAITSGSPEVLAMVLSAGAKIDNEPNRKDFIQLAIKAIDGQNAGILEAVLKLAPADGAPDARAVPYAVQLQKWSALEVFAKAPAFAKYTDDAGNTIAHYATLADSRELITALKAVAGVDLSARNRLNQSPLHIAIQQNKPLAAQALVQAGVDPMAPDQQENSPIKLALAKRMDAVAAEMVSTSKPAREFLMAADPSAMFAGGMNLTARALLAGGMPLDARMSTGVTPLGMVLRAQPMDMEMVGWLLDKGADVNATFVIDGIEDVTPLMMAVVADSEEAVKRLRSKGAKVDLATSRGATAKAIASSRGLTRMVELLD